MKQFLMGITVLMLVSCQQPDTTTIEMESVNTIELVLWKAKEGVSTEAAKTAITTLNDFVSQQPGFVARKTGLAEDGQFIDIVYWTDLKSAKTASEKAMNNEDLLPAFNTIEEKEMVFKHFEVFNSVE